MNTRIEVKTHVKKNIDAVWKLWISPKHIVNWYFASEDWHCPAAESDFEVNGAFSYRMEAKDGSFGFDFTGTITEIIEHEKIVFRLDDNRKVFVTFVEDGSGVLISEIFDAELETSIEMQKNGLLAILDNFKDYAESQGDIV